LGRLPPSDLASKELRSHHSVLISKKLKKNEEKNPTLNKIVRGWWSKMTVEKVTELTSSEQLYINKFDNIEVEKFLETYNLPVMNHEENLNRPITSRRLTQQSKSS